jgi:hypothetical protein
MEVTKIKSMEKGEGYWPIYDIPVCLRYLRNERGGEVNAIINRGLQ